MNIKTMGIDLAKNVFQIHGVNEHGQVVVKATQQALLELQRLRAA